MIQGERMMQDFTIKVFQACEPITIKAESESEAKAIIEQRLKENKLEFAATQINIRDHKQHWFKSFIEDNF